MTGLSADFSDFIDAQCSVSLKAKVYGNNPPTLKVPDGAASIDNHRLCVQSKTLSIGRTELAAHKGKFMLVYGIFSHENWIYWMDSHATTARA